MLTVRFLLLIPFWWMDVVDNLAPSSMFRVPFRPSLVAPGGRWIGQVRPQLRGQDGDGGL